MSAQSPKSIMRRMPIDLVEDESHHGALNKSLGLWQLTAIGVGGIVGVGIFSLAGLVAHGDEQNPGVGPAVLVSFLIAGLASAAAALSYAEFAGMIPRAGSAYTYGFVALGEFIGWFIGWDLLLEYIAVVAVVALGISGYVEAFLAGFGVHLPVWMTASFEEASGGVVNLPAVLICLLVTFILSRGTKTFGRFELVAVAIKVLLILFIIGLGIFYVDTANYNPFMPTGLGPVLTGAATVFFAVFGYDAMSTAAEEAEDGRKHMPKAILLSLIIAMLLYVAATLVLTGMQNYREIDPTAGISSAFLAGVFPIRAVADLTNIGILAAFVVVCLSVILFRYTRPEAPRTFRLPLMPFVPAFGVLASLFLILQLHWETWARFGVWLLIGLVIYFSYGRKHSVLDPDSPNYRHDLVQRR